MSRRHSFFWWLLRPLVSLFLRIKFGYQYEIARNLPDNYIVLANHNTDFDPLFVAVSFKRQMYFVASEHIARWKHVYKWIEFVFAPIVRYKGSVATSTVMEMLRTIRQGGNVCMFAEGARSWDGVTAPILASTGKVVKSAKCGLVTYKLEGGYFVSPNWSQGGTRRGRIRGGVVNIYTPEQLAAMSVDEVNRVITDDLHEDAYARQLASPSRYQGKQLAYKMENLLFCCPQCGKIDTMRSCGDTVQCLDCGLHFRYNEYGMLEGLTQRTVKELFAWEKQVVHDTAACGGAFTARSGTLATVVQHQQNPVTEGPVRLDCQSLRCGEVTIPISQISDMAMHGRRALVFSVGKDYYELIPSQEANALKFHMLYQVYKHGEITQYNGRVR